MKLKPPLISIGIVSYDNPTYLDLLLKGFVRNTTNSFEVLVHGNCASNAFRAVIDKYKDIVNYYQESAGNRYIAVPTNEIFAHAKGEYFFRMSDDMYSPPQWDELLLAEIDPENIFKMISPARYDPPPTSRNAHNFGTTPENFEEDRFNKEYLDHRQITKNTCAIVGELFMPRALWEAVGGYSEKFPRKHDIEFPHRLWAMAKEKINPTCVADAPFYHFGSIGNNKAKFSGPDNRHMELLIDAFGQEALNEFNAFMAKLRKQDTANEVKAA